MPSFSGTWPSIVKPADSSPPITILSWRSSSPMYLKPTAVLVDRRAVRLRDGVEAVRRRDRARHAARVAAFRRSRSRSARSIRQWFGLT